MRNVWWLMASSMARTIRAPCTQPYIMLLLMAKHCNEGMVCPTFVGMMTKAKLNFRSGKDMATNVFQLFSLSWYVLIYDQFVSVNLASFLPTHSVVTPRGRKPRLSLVSSSHGAKAGIARTDFYWDFVPQEDHATMPTLEVEVKMVREFKDDEEVEYQVGGIIPDLGCTKT